MPAYRNPDILPGPFHVSVHVVSWWRLYVKQKLDVCPPTGIQTVILPARNEPDLEDVPEDVLSKLDVRPVRDIREALEIALEPAHSRTAVPA